MRVRTVGVGVDGGGKRGGVVGLAGCAGGFRSRHLPYRRHIGSRLPRWGRDSGVLGVCSRRGVAAVVDVGVSMSLGTWAGSAHAHCGLVVVFVGVGVSMSLGTWAGSAHAHETLGDRAGSAPGVPFGVVGGVGVVAEGVCWLAGCWSSCCWSLWTDCSISSQSMSRDFSGVLGANRCL